MRLFRVFMAALSEITADFSWDDLLMFIEAGDTIPVVGPDLLIAPEAKGGGTLPEHLAARLAAELKIDLSRVSDPKSLSQVIVESDLFRKRRQMIYPRLKGVLDRLINPTDFPIPHPLLQLARISPFTLFV